MHNREIMQAGTVAGISNLPASSTHAAVATGAATALTAAMTRPTGQP